jgi:CRISPR/Cas system endoribonuclease Cas6 (RAMP superfamily)
MSLGKIKKLFPTLKGKLKVIKTAFKKLKISIRPVSKHFQRPTISDANPYSLTSCTKKMIFQRKWKKLKHIISVLSLNSNLEYKN